MKRKTIIIISAIILAVAIVSFYLIYKNKNKTLVWKTTPVKRGSISILVKSTGTLNADTTVNVGAQVSGIIWKLYADWNSVVKKGDIIAVIDTTFLSAARIDAQAALERSEATLAQAQRDYDRNKKLLDEKVVDQEDYETVLTTLATAKAQVTSSKAMLNQSLINLKYAVIRAPVSGVVISRNVELGQTVISAMSAPTLFTIVNTLKKIQVQANVDEADVGQIKVGQKCTFTVDAFPDETFTGNVFQIRINPVMVQNVVNYVVIIYVENTDMKLLPGLTANISIHVHDRDSILKVPANAFNFTPSADFISKMTNIPDSIKTRILKKVNVQANTESTPESGTVSKHKSAYIWIKKGEELFPKKVKTGLSDGNFTEVSGDIKEGDEVVIGQGSGTASSANQAAKSPFMPQMPGGRGK
jgi:HlyD family secretion protein